MIIIMVVVMFVISMMVLMGNFKLKVVGNYRMVR